MGRPITAAREEELAVPEEARAWTTSVDGSLHNLRHPAWNSVRRKAADAMDMLSPTMRKMQAFFDQPNPMFRRTALPPVN